jgi:hypothetical protein
MRQSDSTHDTAVPNALLDEHLADLTGAELKVLLFILRWTRGAGQETAVIGYDQFLDGTGLKDRSREAPMKPAGSVSEVRQKWCPLRFCPGHLRERRRSIIRRRLTMGARGLPVRAHRLNQ